jgi:putative PIN family toxin of toxin-antitoxin system
MKIVLDTNVFVSGIFFSGPPYRILRAWREGRVRVAYSPAIILEYRRVLAALSQQFPKINGEPFLDLVTRYGELVHPQPIPGVSCRDPEDVKFLECLLDSKARCLVTGDKDLLKVRTKAALILTPRQFCDRYL